MDYSMAVIWLIIAVACGLIEAGTIALVSVWFVIGAVVSFFMALIFSGKYTASNICIYIIFNIVTCIHKTCG